MKPGMVRIIGGKWRGRRLEVPDSYALRPTPDRVRETVFNWLTARLPGAHCLDLFAGTGVLGFEALSRGAASVDFVETAPLVLTALKKSVADLKAENVTITRGSLPVSIPRHTHPYKIVFLDPPYQADLLLPCCHQLENENHLADKAYIYLESHAAISDHDLPTHWRVIKQQRAGHVFYHLAVRELIENE